MHRSTSFILLCKKKRFVSFLKCMKICQPCSKFYLRLASLFLLRKILAKQIWIRIFHLHYLYHVIQRFVRTWISHQNNITQSEFNKKLVRAIYSFYNVHYDSKIFYYVYFIRIYRASNKRIGIKFSIYWQFFTILK